MKYAPMIALCLCSAFSTVLAQEPKIPVVIADDTSVAHLPQQLEPNMKGYGTRGVEGETLHDMLASCRLPAQLSRVQAYRCAQLQRSLKTSPDGTLEETLKKGK